MKSPAFQFYPTDYIASQRVQMLTLAEEGAYIRLLCYCWQHGSIPADPEHLARLIGKGASTTLATVVAAMFDQGPTEGRLIHARLELERSKQAAWREKSAEGGRKSSEKRKGASTTLQPPYEPKANTPSSSSSPSSISVSNSKTLGKTCPAVAGPASDSDWLKTLQGNAAYAGLNIETEYAKMKAWCEANRRQPTRRRFVNWLNRADKPMEVTPPDRWMDNIRRREAREKAEAERKANEEKAAALCADLLEADTTAA